MIHWIIEKIARLLQILAEAWGRFWNWVICLFVDCPDTVELESVGSINVTTE